MPQPQFTLYSTQKTAIWFAVASILLVVFLVLMVFEDYDREWKHWQRRFVKYEREKIQAELEEADRSVDQQKLESLKSKLAETQAAFEEREAEYRRLIKKRGTVDIEAVKANSKYQDLKQYYDSYKYFLEEHRAHGETEKAAEYERKMTDVGEALAQAKAAKDDIEQKLDEMNARIQSFEADEKRLEKEINKLVRDRDQVERKLKQLKPSLAKAVLNAPMVDFIAPTLQIQQIVLEDLYDDMHFQKTQKVDRCVSCHLAIDRSGFEDAPQPFRTHPDLDLFLAADSPHPIESVGCTVCHSGNGHSLAFTYAAHTPQNEEQAKAWAKEHGWHELEKWEAKMLPLQHVEASCIKCHTGVVDVPKAPQLNAGRELARKYGCFGCHLVKGFEDQWKVGPSLYKVASKVDREWIVRWLQNPKDFRPSTQMPRIFHLENTDSAEDRIKSDAAIEGIATYLLKHSEALELKSPPGGGDPETGKVLVETLGCLGCHNVAGVRVNDHGPELIHLGSKVTPEWLFTWLKNPRDISEHTRMPDLRLSDEEASHITAYLTASRNEGFESTPLPQVKEADVDALALDYMSRKLRLHEAQENLGGMDLEAKFEFVGRQMILQQGCFGCHDIHGFEDVKRIGTELTKEGEKEVSKLDFGFVPIDHSRQAWFFQKMKNTRIFDRGRVKGYHEKLRMPQFDFSDEEAAALTTFLLSLRDEDIPLEMQRRLDLREQEIEAGRFLVAKYNCQGCHTLDGVEGRVRRLFDDAGNAPPELYGEGAKVQEFWLYHFLEKPETIRPWLKYRMPTFGFTEDEANKLIRYFANLDEQQFSFAPDETAHATAESIHAGHELFTKLQCIKCHQPNQAAGLTASFLAPDLVLARDRLKPQWVIEWLKDPQALQPGTMMPGFFPDGQTPIPDILDGDWLKQIRAIRDYLWAFTPEEAELVTELT